MKSAEELEDGLIQVRAHLEGLSMKRSEKQTVTKDDIDLAVELIQGCEFLCRKVSQDAKEAMEQERKARRELAEKKAGR